MQHQAPCGTERVAQVATERIYEQLRHESTTQELETTDEFCQRWRETMGAQTDVRNRRKVARTEGQSDDGACKCGCKRGCKRGCQRE